MSNIELLKKNGELIAKYHNKLTNEVRRLTDEPVDDEAISRCNSEMLSILNEFAFERDKLYGVDLDQVSVPFVQENNDRQWIIKLHDKDDKNYDDMYVSLFAYDKDKDKLTWKVDSLKGFALSLTYIKADEYVKILSEYAKKNNLTFVPEIVDYNKEGVKLVTDKNYIIHLIDKSHSDCNDSYLTYYNFTDFDYEDSINRYNASKFTYEEANKVALKLKEKISKSYDIHIEPFEVLTTDEILEKAYSPTKKAYETTMNTVSKRKENFNRTESLTFAETDREEEWCKKHNEKYHKKDDKKKIKKKPFYGGVSPTGRFITVWQYCSISSWCECICKDCYSKYLKEKDKLERLAGDAKNYKKQKKLVEKLYKKATFTVRNIDE